MSIPDFHDLRGQLNGLSLHEVDFTVGDAFVSRIRDLKVAIDRLDTSAEPWVAKWLSAEHYKAGVLWTAAKTNWAKEQSSGADSTFNAQTRAAIVERFNAWASELQQRLTGYEHSGRTAADVAEWCASLERFKRDPLSNP